ncbi:glycosyltransferase, partial [Pyxidicoccus sp. 3LG]
MSDLPRLLLCSFDVIPGPSGSSRRVTEYLKALPDRFSVVVLSAKTPDHSHIEKYQGARLLRVPVGSGDLASRIQAFERAVRRQLESEDYALAHFTDPFGGYALCEMKADYGYRLIYEAQTLPSQELRYTHPQTEGDRRFLSKVRRQELFCLMNADLIVTGSQTTRSYIQSLGASQDLIRVLRAPVDLQPYAPDVLGAPDGTPLRLMYLGSQVGWQGLSTLLRALALAVKQVEVRLTLVGARHSDWQPHLDDLVKELELKDRVEFQAPVIHDDLAKVLALADVGVLPLDDVERNRLQGGPLAKVSEYFAAGRPVIAADLPVTRELIPPGTAVFFPPGDPKALADRIVELARDIPRRVALGRQARAHAEEALDAGLIRGKLLDLYDSLLDKRSVPVAARGEDDLPSPTTVTGTPTNRLAALLPPEPTPISKPGAVPSKPGTPPSGAEPSREELPLVMGQVLDEGLDTRLIKTELEAPSAEPPVVMGLPLREQQSSASPWSADSTTPSSPVGDTASPASVVVGPELAELMAAKSRPVAPSLVEEPPAPTPVVRGPGSTGKEEPPAPTPIIKMPASLLMRDDAPAPARSPTTPFRKEEPSAPPLPTTSRPALNGRGTSGRVETPSGRIPSLATPSRGVPSLEPERPSPVLRPGASPSDTGIPALPPMIRGGVTSEPER